MTAKPTAEDALEGVAVLLRFHSDVHGKPPGEHAYVTHLRRVIEAAREVERALEYVISVAGEPATSPLPTYAAIKALAAALKGEDP